jgi:uncharacterized protein (TIGR02147 family)
VPNLFSYLDYKDYILAYLRQLPKGGRGLFTRFAEVCQTHKATISQIFKGDRHLTSEQAVNLGEFLSWTSREIRYFVLLVNYAAAGSEALRKIYLTQIEAEREANMELSNRLRSEQKLTDEQRAIFYSNWIYSAVRVTSSIEGYQTPKRIAEKLKVPVNVVEEAITFLVSMGLCQTKNGQIRPGSQSTYLESKSPLISRHHANWRLKAMERHPILNRELELCYTAPLSISKKDAKKVRELLAQFVEKADAIVAPSECERFFCLNLDWFEVN